VDFINELEEIVNKSLEDILDVIKNYLNIKPIKPKIKIKCSYCGKEDVVINFAKFFTSKHFFCCRGHYYEFKKLPEQKGENFHSYKKVKVKCDYCGKDITMADWMNKRNKNNFCSRECYSEFRSLNYSGENHPLYGKKLTKERINKMREHTIKRYVNGEFGSKKFRNTKIQIKIDELLTEMKINFEKEKVIKYYACDNYLTEHDLIIENMGDFFHSNPTIYNDESSLLDMQKRTKRKDSAKRTYIYKYRNINILYLWETDIKKNIEVCKELIKLYIENPNNLEDYNSFNYKIKDGILKLKEKTIKPYFIR
jgi:ssDNA-binding Zn-finger/Zn-ribbon topoisomerase 1